MKLSGVRYSKAEICAVAGLIEMRWISHRERMRTQMKGWALTWRAVRWDDGPCADTIRRLSISLAVHFREQSTRLNHSHPC